MSRILTIKVSEDPMDRDEAIDTIKALADEFHMRITIGDRDTEDDPRFDVMDMMDMHEKDLATSIEKGNLMALIDEEEGIVGYLIEGSGDGVLAHLNGTRDE